MTEILKSFALQKSITMIQAHFRGWKARTYLSILSNLQGIIKSDVPEGLVEKLFALGAHKTISEGSTLIHWAAKYGYIDIMNTLLDLGGDKDLENELGHTPIFSAIKGNFLLPTGSISQPKMVKRLLDVGVNPNVIASNGLSPLQFAVERDNLKVVELLLEAGANPNVKQVIGKSYAKYGKTPLYHVSMYPGKNALKIIQLLKAYGANLNVKREVGANFTPLHIASYQGHAHVVKKLLALGADKNVLDSNGRKPEFFATFLEGYPDLNRVQTTARKFWMEKAFAN